MAKRDNLLNLAGKLVKIKEEAERLGIFTGDRELLECPKCGLIEDVDAYGRLFTVFKDAPYKDTGLNFREVGNKENTFCCPNCGKVIAVNEL